MPEMEQNLPIEYWDIKIQIDKNKRVQRIRNTISKERKKHLNMHEKLEAHKACGFLTNCCFLKRIF